MKILAIETSCDETACAVVEDLPAGRQVGLKIISNVVASSKAVHEKYGGIVPEVAAREQLRSIIPVLDEALLPLTNILHKSNTPKTNTTVLHSTKVFHEKRFREIIEKSIDMIAVTIGPGLIGSLLVGVETAKTIAFVTGKPIIPVNHVIAHMYANFLDSSVVIPGVTRNPSSSKTGSRLGGRDDKKEIQFPAISLVVSGGHTELYLMKSVKELTWLGGTLDDAAGECFDKTARLLGFGHGGGVAIERASRSEVSLREKAKLHLPRPMINDESYNFSFSGLKTAVMRECKKHLGLKGSDPLATVASGDRSVRRSETGSDPVKTSFAYEIQEAITDVLVKKTLRAAKQYNARSILLSGGVAANLRLREKFLAKLQTNDLTKLSLHVPPVPLCTDNAVYIASYAFFRGKPSDWHSIDATPDLPVEV